MEHGTAIFSIEHEKEAGEGGGGSRGATAGYVRMEESLEWEDDEWQCTQVRMRVAFLSLGAQGPVRRKRCREKDERREYGEDTSTASVATQRALSLIVAERAL